MFYIDNGAYFAAGGGGAARLPTGFTTAGGGINGRWIPWPACFFDEEAGGSSSWAALLGRGGVFSSACTLLDDDCSEELDSWLSVGVTAGHFIASSFRVCWQVFLAAGASAGGATRSQSPRRPLLQIRRLPPLRRPSFHQVPRRRAVGASPPRHESCLPATIHQSELRARTVFKVNRH